MQLSDYSRVSPTSRKLTCLPSLDNYFRNLMKQSNMAGSGGVFTFVILPVVIILHHLILICSASHTTQGDCAAMSPFLNIGRVMKEEIILHDSMYSI